MHLEKTNNPTYPRQMITIIRIMANNKVHTDATIETGNIIWQNRVSASCILTVLNEDVTSLNNFLASCGNFKNFVRNVKMVNFYLYLEI